MTEIKDILLTRRAVAPLLVMAAIFALSAQSFDGPQLAWWEVGLRKAAHMAEYATLVAAWWWALRPGTDRALPLAFIAAVAYACTDEYHQTFVPGRHGTPLDVLIDAAGAAIGAAWLHRIDRHGPSNAPRGDRAR